MCITELLPGERYLALSYAWGRVANFELRRESHESLLLPNSLSRHWSEIPRTIRDAILFIREIRFTCLWADSFSIIQNDDEHKALFIGRMATIYSEAYLTIVAADGEDANHELRGVGQSPRAAPPQTIIDLCSAGSVSIQTFGVQITLPQKYFKRAWTFQEYQLSSRLLVFIGNMVVWRCREHEHRETLLHPELYGILPRYKNILDLSWPDFYCKNHNRLGR